jgi:hypothetical protein
MKFDDAEHYFLEFESELPNEAGAVPMGMYLSWLAGRRLLSSNLAARLASPRAGSTTWAARLFELCDGKLMSDDLNEDGEAFTRDYYPGYLRDYSACLGLADETADGLCAVPESPENLDKIRHLLDRRWEQWKSGKNGPAPAPEPEKPTVASVRADLLERVVPVLEADGFRPRPARADELVLVRRVGCVEQSFRIALLCRNEEVSISYWFRFGCSKLRRVWLALLDPTLRANPPALYDGDFYLYPDLQAEEWNLTSSGHLMVEYAKRFVGQSQALAQRTLALYREQLKPVLDHASSPKALADIAQTGMQMTRQRSHLGHILGIELLGRIVLLAAYTPLLSGASAATMRKELLQQWNSGGVYRQSEDFPDRAIIERLLDVVIKPGFVGQARAFLDA